MVIHIEHKTTTNQWTLAGVYYCTTEESSRDVDRRSGNTLPGLTKRDLYFEIILKM